MVTWQKPKLNMAMVLQGEYGGCGFFIRTDAGLCFLAGGFCQSCNINYQELLAAKMGLQQALQLNLHKIHIATDDLVIVDILSRKKEPPWQLVNLVRRIFDLLVEIWVSLIFHDGNQCAEWLANSVCSTRPFLWMDHLPDLFPYFLSADLSSPGCVM